MSYLNQEEIQRHKRLVSAVILQAIVDYQDTSTNTDDHIDSVMWLSSDSMEPYSYHWCCAALDISPDRIFDQLETKDVIKKTKLDLATRSKAAHI